MVQLKLSLPVNAARPTLDAKFQSAQTTVFAGITDITDVENTKSQQQALAEYLALISTGKQLNP